ncbi:MAG: ribonuclease Z [Bacteroidota bacterium]|nr:ribonuclease Z [Bacteroidota bacterium]
MSFSYTVLGSSSALPTSTRNLSAYVLHIHERIFLLDCGEGTQMQLRKNKVKLGRLNHIFISHIHGDHTFGLFGLLSSFNLMGRKNELHIYGPPELDNILNIHLELFDIKLFYPLIFHRVDCGSSERIYEDRLVYVDSFPLLHRIPTCGYLFVEKEKSRSLKPEMIELYNIPIQLRSGIKNGADFISDSGQRIPNKTLTKDALPGRSFAYCTDTMFNRGIVSKIKNIDLLFHESTYMEEDSSLAKNNFHSTARQAAMIAKEAGVKKLILGHFSTRYKNLNLLLDEARLVFPESFLAEDGQIWEIER